MAITFEEADLEIITFVNQHKNIDRNEIKLIKNYRDLWSENPSLETMQGGYYPKKNLVLIVSDTHKSLEELQTTLKHEIYGHHATYRLEEKQKLELLQSIIKLEDNCKVKPYWDNVQKYYPNISKLAQAEEVFAFIAEKCEKELIKFLSSIDSKKVINLTDELYQLIEIQTKNNITNKLIEINSSNLL